MKMMENYENKISILSKKEEYLVKVHKDQKEKVEHILLERDKAKL